MQGYDKLSICKNAVSGKYNKKAMSISKARNTNKVQIGKGVLQGCVLSLCWFNIYAEYIMQNARLYEAQARTKIAGRNINNPCREPPREIPPWQRSCGRDLTGKGGSGLKGPLESAWASTPKPKSVLLFCAFHQLFLTLTGGPFPPPMHESEKWKWSRSVVSDS